MSIFSFAFLLIGVSATSLDYAAEDLFPTSNSDIFDDDTSASLIASSDNTYEQPYFVKNLNFESSGDPSMFLVENFPEEDSTLDFLNLPSASIDEGYSEPLLEGNVFHSEADSSVFTPDSLSSCEDSSVEPEDFTAELYSENDSSFSSNDPSAYSTNTENSFVAASVEGLDNKVTKPTGPAKTFPLDPNTSPTTRTTEAYAADGTPIQPQKCQPGKSHTCCLWNAIAPFSRCWRKGTHHGVCQYAQNRVCCASVSKQGGPGIDCEKTKWVVSRDGRAPRVPQDPPSSSQLQELFPILQDLTPLQDSNPASCRPRPRS
jgi:hypothetical protein